MIGLTRQQADLLAFIKAYTAQHGVCPSYQEMQAAAGLKSKSGIPRMLAALEERGRIRRLHNRARAIEVVTRNSLVGVSTADLLAELERRRPGIAALALAA